MVSLLIVIINHIWMYTYVSEWFTRWLYYAVELCHRFVGVKHELLSKTTSANVKDYLSCIIGRDINQNLLYICLHIQLNFGDNSVLTGLILFVTLFVTTMLYMISVLCWQIYFLLDLIFYFVRLLLPVATHGHTPSGTKKNAYTLAFSFLFLTLHTHQP